VPDLSLSLAGLANDPAAPWAGGPRRAIEWAAGLGYRAVQLDATAAGIRPRELDRSARRDLAALLRRHELSVSGLDLWAPASHFAHGPDTGRALAAVAAAAELAAELRTLIGGSSRAVVAIALAAKPAEGVLTALAGASEHTGAAIADHAWPPAHEAVGIDPAAMLLAGADPAAEILRLAAVPVTARWTDLGPAGRTARGRGRLDVLAYDVALTTRGVPGPRIVDLRDLKDQRAAAVGALEG